ncbi:MAG: NAD-dependent epimerase/dehydratase family protein [Kangiellaceae bacterium]|jgi:2'-hydroxyisoflavone reductase|nr:NAD-dependent epimerase/dehydratase family protein [Kangiellaceae bacterium]
MDNRRSFIKTSILAGVGLSTLPVFASPSGKKLKILIMGGTGFLGPHTVNAALAQGHTVTLFNRGKSNPHLFPDLEKIKGDRNTKDIEKLKDRKWDVVIDTSAYYPRSINMAMEVLKENIDQYLLVSTISVYSDWSVVGMDESAPVATMEDPTSEDVRQFYGPLKALCEQAAVKHMPGKVTVIRPGLIVGPLDKTDRFTYWPVRVSQGGEILAPGDGTDYIQFIDVRDLAEWMVYCLDHSIIGTFNAQSNGKDITMKNLLDSCVKMINPTAQVTWVPTEFLEKHQVQPWAEMPVWIPAKGAYAGSGMMSSVKAYSNGLKQRPIDSVVKDCFDWYQEQPAERKKQLRAGISKDKEQKVLAAWAKHTAGKKS